MYVQAAFKIVKVYLCFFSLYPNAAFGGHIVGMANHYYSHQSTVRKLGKELISRGHRYTQLIPHFLASQFTDIDLIVINTSLTMHDIDDIGIKVMQAGDMSSFQGMYRITQLVEEASLQASQLCQDMLENEDIIRELKGNVDMFLCDITSTCCFVLADMMHVNRVDVSSLGFGGAGLGFYFGFPQAAVYLTQENLIDATDPLKFSFTRRLLSFLHYRLMRLVFFRMISEDVWVKYAKPTSQYAYMIDAWRPHNLVLIGHDFALEYPRPMGPHIKVIGAILPSPPQHLPDDFCNFMDKNKDIVLVAFGSSNFNSSLLQVIADGLGKVSATVLWKISGNVSLNVAKNIKIVSWILQNDILAHTSTKVFITHCGLNSILESAYHGVPMVGIPLLGDQHRQAYVVKVKRLGVVLDKNTMKPEELTMAVHEVLNSKSYRSNAKHISSIMRDRKRSPAEEGADWIEYALHHNGAKHLYSEAIDLPEYQLYCYDVILFLLLMLAITIFIFVKICSCVCYSKTLVSPDKIKKN